MPILMLCIHEGNGRTQRIFIESLAKINGINLDLTLVSKEEIIVASYDSINGNYKKLRDMFRKYSVLLDDKQTKQNIKLFCTLELQKLFLK